MHKGMVRLWEQILNNHAKRPNVIIQDVRVLSVCRETIFGVRKQILTHLFGLRMELTGVTPVILDHDLLKLKQFIIQIFLGAALGVAAPIVGHGISMNAIFGKQGLVDVLGLLVDDGPARRMNDVFCSREQGRFHVDGNVMLEANLSNGIQKQSTLWQVDLDGPWVCVRVGWKGEANVNGMGDLFEGHLSSVHGS